MMPQRTLNDIQGHQKTMPIILFYEGYGSMYLKKVNYYKNIEETAEGKPIDTTNFNDSNLNKI